MNITLNTNAYDSFIQELLDSKKYKNQEEIIIEAIELLRQKDKLEQKTKELQSLLEEADQAPVVQWSIDESLSRIEND